MVWYSRVHYNIVHHSIVYHIIASAWTRRRRCAPRAPSSPGVAHNITQYPQNITCRIQNPDIPRAGRGEARHGRANGAGPGGARQVGAELLILLRAARRDASVRSRSAQQESAEVVIYHNIL